jgi:hypothetical protein
MFEELGCNKCTLKLNELLLMQVHSALGHIMYNTNCPNDRELDSWVKAKLAKVANKMPIANSFWSYIKFEWLQKIEIWVVGNHNLPYAGQDTNVAIENYHANLKAIFCSSKGRFHGRHVDWAIHELVGNVLCHY